MTHAAFVSLGLSPPSGRCAVTDSPIEPGESYIAGLVESPDEDKLVRWDCSLSAWDDGARPEAPCRLFAFWRTSMPDRNAPRPIVPAGAVLDVIEQLADSDDPRRQAIRYLLTLTLIRRRTLVYEGGRPAQTGRPGLVRVRAWTKASEPMAESFEVVDPGIDRNELDSLAAELGEVMPDAVGA